MSIQRYFSSGGGDNGGSLPPGEPAEISLQSHGSFREESSDNDPNFRTSEADRLEAEEMELDEEDCEFIRDTLELERALPGEAILQEVTAFIRRPLDSDDNETVQEGAWRLASESGRTPTEKKEMQLQMQNSTHRTTATSLSSLSSVAGINLARAALNSLVTTNSGWCKLSKLAPNKKDGQGYIQLSFQGVNKFASLQLVVLWANGGFIGYEGTPQAEQASHLCHKPACTVVGHVIAESVQANNRRKGCVGHVSCAPKCTDCHGQRSISVCPHEPHCIVYCPGYSSPEDFRARGICGDRALEVRNRVV